MIRFASRAFVLVLLLLYPLHGLAEEKPFVSPDQIDFSRLLAPPPAVGSVQQTEEMAVLMAFQKNRTQDQVAFARADMDRNVFRFSDVMGPDFTKDRLPLAAAFFEKAKKDADHMLSQAKKHWNRPRPYETTPDLVPCLDKPGNASYPSGHSMFATLTAIILANMVPEKGEQIFARGVAYAQNRIIGGVHYPSDVLAGRISGTVIAAFMFQNPNFQAEYAKVRDEVRNALHLP